MLAAKVPDSLEERQWLEALRDNHTDKALIGIYADWLEEHGEQPDGVRQTVENAVETWDGFEIQRHNYHGADGKTVPHASCRRIGSSACKSLWNYSFYSAIRREAFIADWKLAEIRKAADRAERSAAKKAVSAEFVNPYKVGDIFYTSWGYDQTNINWFQAVKIGPKSVTVREIAGDRTETTWAAGTTMPRPGEFIGSPKLSKIQFGIQSDGQARHWLPAHAHSSYYPWEGRAVGWSAYA